MKPREYCCCAIPTVNAGIYATLTEQLVLAIVVGVLSVATPSIVGAATPSFATWILGIICFAAAGIQILGFMGVAQEKSILYRRYVSLHSLLTAAAFAVAAAWIIISASRHGKAKAKCLDDFFPSTSGESAGEGDTLCQIFPWVDVGVMGGLWAILAIMQGYLYFVLISYGKSQRQDHAKYNKLGDPGLDVIPMNTRGDPWDSRLSTDSPPSPTGHPGYGHTRHESGASMSDVMNQPRQQPKDSLSHNEYQDQDYAADDRFNPYDLQHPTYAHTQDPGPTPQYQDSYYNGQGSELGRPQNSLPHPAEGSFHRKTPRLGND